MLMGLLLPSLVSEACQMSISAWYPLNAIGWLVEAATLLEITTKLVEDTRPTWI